MSAHGASGGGDTTLTATAVQAREKTVADLKEQFTAKKSELQRLEIEFAELKAEKKTLDKRHEQIRSQFDAFLAATSSNIETQKNQNKTLLAAASQCESLVTSFSTTTPVLSQPRGRPNVATITTVSTAGADKSTKTSRILSHELGSGGGSHIPTFPKLSPPPPPATGAVVPSNNVEDAKYGECEGGSAGDHHSEGEGGGADGPGADGPPTTENYRVEGEGAARLWFCQKTPGCTHKTNREVNIKDHITRCTPKLVEDKLKKKGK